MTEYKKYRLLKDLPGLRAGAVFTYNPGVDGYVYEGINGFAGYSTKVVENNPDWFKMLDEFASGGRQGQTEAWWV